MGETREMTHGETRGVRSVVRESVHGEHFSGRARGGSLLCV